MAYLYALIASVLWGIAPIFDKLSLNQCAPPVTMFWRTMGSATFAVIIALMMKQSAGLAPWPGWIWGLAAGCLGAGLGNLLFLHALKQSQASIIVMLSAGYPLVTAIVALIVLKEPVTMLRFIGAVFIIVGGILVIKS